jgi:hypothetical protein
MNFKLSYFFLSVMILIFSFLLIMIESRISNIFFISFISIYMMFFLLRDFNLRKKEFDLRMKIKKRKNLKINPYV